MTDPAREAAERIVAAWNEHCADGLPRKNPDAVIVSHAYLAIPTAQPGDREALARAINCALPFPAGFDDDDAGGRRALCYSAADAILAWMSASGFRRDGVREAKRKAWHVERHDDVITRYRHTCGLTLDTTARDFWLHCPACDPAPPGESGA